MYLKNAELDRAFAFIRDSEWDVFCLQEVPETFLKRLRTLPAEVASAIESDRIINGERMTIYSVTLSRLPIHSTKSIPLPLHELNLPVRGKLFLWFMYAIGLWIKGVGSRYALRTDVETVPGTVRILNLHLLLPKSPKARVAEFEGAMLEHDPTVPSIICGDFNTVEAPHLSILNWIFGGNVGDSVFYTRERLHLEKRFAEYEVTNALRGKVTHPLAQSQLDHILVSKHFTIQNATVIPELFGSDHHPIFIETT
jgi:endonuclease/exonuclease/phosphatase family metal-dependent hydrolase